MASDFGTPRSTKSRMKVVLSARVGVSGVLCHLDSQLVPPDIMLVILDIMSDIYIRC